MRQGALWRVQALGIFWSSFFELFSFIQTLKMSKNVRENRLMFLEIWTRVIQRLNLLQRWPQTVEVDFFPKDDNLGVLKSIRVQLRVWGWAGVGACGGEGVGGRPDPPDGRKSVPYFSLYATSVSTGLPRAERWMVDFQSISERKWCKMQDFRRFTIGKGSIGRFSKHEWTQMMRNGWFPRLYYCKRDHLSIFKA